MFDPKIREITSKCEREDCRIEAGMTMATCMGSLSYYDKDGTYHINDPNYYRTQLQCLSCNRRWTKTRHNNETTIEELDE